MLFRNLQQTLFYSLLILISVLFVWLINPYLQSVFWAIVLAVLFYPLQKVWLKVTKKSNIWSTILTLVSVFIIVLVPLYFLTQALVGQTIDLYTQISQSQRSITDRQSIAHSVEPVIQFAQQLGYDRQEVITKISQAAQSVGQYLAEKTIDAGQNVAQFVVQFFVMFYVLYFLLKDGPNLIKKLMHILPLGDRKEQRLIKKFHTTARATVKGTFIIGIVQGTLGGLLFWAVGIKGAVIWGSLMTVLSIIPAVGSFLVWFPAGVILLFTGHIWQGVVVLVVGTAIISLVDNLLRPPLVGKDTEMPDVLVLLSTLGGLSLFGISGFIIGPIIAAFFLSMWNMFEEEHRKELNEMG